MEQRDLVKFNTDALVSLDKSGVLREWLPKALQSIENVAGRAQTSFMDKHMVIGERPTRIGQARQCLAEISSIVAALQHNGLDTSDVHIRGAIKRAINFCEAYQSICKELEVDHITDEMVEANQPEEHLKTMFMQSLRAACSTGGLVDEGDLIYANQVGVSVSECQLEVQEFLLRDGKIRKFTMTEQRDWIDSMWETYKGRVCL